MNSNSQKYNKLSVIAFILTFTGLFVTNVKPSIGAISTLIGLILGIVSFFQIRKTGEKGKGLLITLLVLFILMIISMILLYLPTF